MAKLEKYLPFVSLAVSILALIVAYSTHLERTAFDRAQSKSNIVIQVERDINQKNITFEKYEGDPEFSAIFKQRYNLIINNIGFRPASIINWSVLGKPFIRTPYSTRNAYGSYQGMGPLFFTEDDIPIKLPLTIEPNKPQKFIILVGVRVPKIAWKAVVHKLEIDKEYNYYEAEAIFSEYNYSQFGQYQLHSVPNEKTYRKRSYIINILSFI